MKGFLVAIGVLAYFTSFIFAAENRSASLAPGGANLSVADVEVAPVPWVPNDDVASNGNLTDGIQFKNLPQEAGISIYTISGALVKKIIVTNNIGQAYIVWDGKNEDGEEASSGVYVWIVKSNEGKKTGKIVIIR